MAQTLPVGSTAPDFTLPSTHGELTLSQWLRDGPVLLVFYPKDGSAVCTRQLCDYRDNLDMFQGLGVRVLAISTDSESAHQAFAEQKSFPFPLLSDARGRVAASYGALNLLGYAKRALVLVGSDGLVKWSRTDMALFYQGAKELREVLTGLLAGA